jgi:hypothetical protein
MKRKAVALFLCLSFIAFNSYATAAEDLTTLSRDTVREGAAKSQIYFVMIDRFANGDTSNDEGGLTGFSAITGYDPADIGYFHGGDLKGLTEKLDYIAGLGLTQFGLPHRSSSVTFKETLLPTMVIGGLISPQ